MKIKVTIPVSVRIVRNYKTYVETEVEVDNDNNGTFNLPSDLEVEQIARDLIENEQDNVLYEDTDIWDIWREDVTTVIPDMDGAMTEDVEHKLIDAINTMNTMEV